MLTLAPKCSYLPKHTKLTSLSSVFTCNTFYLDKAYKNNTYSYYYTIPPALHGMDIPYTYYNGPNPTAVMYPKIAIALQEYITAFAMTGAPNEKGVPMFSMYGDNATVQDLGATGRLRLDCVGVRC